MRLATLTGGRPLSVRATQNGWPQWLTLLAALNAGIVCASHNFLFLPNGWPQWLTLLAALNAGIVRASHFLPKCWPQRLILLPQWLALLAALNGGIVRASRNIHSGWPQWLTLLAALNGSIVRASHDFLQVGCSLDLTSWEAVHFYNGYRFWEYSVNKVGGIKVGDRRFFVNLTVMEDEGGAAEVRKNYEMMAKATSPKFNFLLGPYTSRLTMEAIESVRPYNITLVAAGASSDKIYTENPYPFLFSSNILASRYSESTVKFAVDTGAKTFSLIYEDSPYGQALANGVQLQIAKYPHARLAFQDSYPAGRSSAIHAAMARAMLLDTDVFLALGHYEDNIMTAQLVQLMEYAPKMAAFVRGLTNAPLFELFVGAQLWHPSLSYGRSDGPLGTTAEFVDNFERWAQQPVDLYDALGASAPALLQMGLEYSQSIERDAVAKAFREIDDELFIGPVKLGPGGNNEKMEAVMAQVIGGKILIQLKGQEQVFKYPAPWPWLARELVLPSDHNSQRILVNLAFIFGILSALLIPLLYRLRHTEVIRAGSYPFLVLFLVGTSISYLAVVPLLWDPNGMACLLQVWMPQIGFVLVFGALLTKNWRLKRIFMNESLESLHTLTDYLLMRKVAFLLLISLGLLFLWQFIDPSLPTIVDSTQIMEKELMCCSRKHAYYNEDDGYWHLRQEINPETRTRHSSPQHSPFLYVLLVFNLCVLLYAAVLCFKLRNVHSKFQENKAVSIATYNCLVAIVLEVILLRYWNGPGHSYISITAVAILFVATVNVFAIVLFKFFLLVFPSAVQRSVSLVGDSRAARIESQEQMYELKQLRASNEQLHRECVGLHLKIQQMENRLAAQHLSSADRDENENTRSTLPSSTHTTLTSSPELQAVEETLPDEFNLRLAILSTAEDPITSDDFVFAHAKPKRLTQILF
eukprot:g9133.t1